MGRAENGGEGETEPLNGPIDINRPLEQVPLLFHGVPLVALSLSPSNPNHLGGGG